ncbi:MAG: hypothetical protein ACE5HO_13600 [bacterium]
MRLLFVIVVAVTMAMIASKKGFNPLLWVLAGGIPGFFILLFLPSANADGISEATREIRIKRRNIVGAVITTIAITVLIGLLAMISNI